MIGLVWPGWLAAMLSGQHPCDLPDVTSQELARVNAGYREFVRSWVLPALPAYLVQEKGSRDVLVEKIAVAIIKVESVLSTTL